MEWRSSSGEWPASSLHERTLAPTSRIRHRLLRSFFWLVVRDHFYGTATDCESELLVCLGDKTYSRRRALPRRRRAFCTERLVVSGFAQRLFQDGLATPDLHHHGRKFATVLRDSAVGNIVPVPAG